MGDKRSLSERLAGASGRQEAPRDLVARNQRERILAAAAEAVGEHGYGQTTIESIAKTARVALVTFYRHFADKEECVLAAFDASVDAASEALAARLDPERPWPEQLATALAGALELVVAEPARPRLCIAEIQGVPGGLPRYHAALDRIGAWLRRGRALSPRGEQLPEGLEAGLAGGLVWLLHRRLAAGRLDEVESLLPEMLEIALGPYVGAEEARRAAAAAQARTVA